MPVATLQDFPRPRTTSENITVLTVSPLLEDCRALQGLFHHDEWLFRHARGVREAAALLPTLQPAVVVCERNLEDGSWHDLLRLMEAQEHPPVLIVTARLPESRLWAEVLNLGGYDVLAKPFDRAEVLRVLGMAWRHWRVRHAPPSLRVPAGALHASG